ncbi:hypothetical protein [Streptomyces sp. NPDC047315]|uniref:hypothetical protein n=1 Tax=Streptomyces sp. NPDC047315 TaxID=3155142 RepID=UPI003402D375
MRIAVMTAGSRGDVALTAALREVTTDRGYGERARALAVRLAGEDGVRPVRTALDALARE